MIRKSISHDRGEETFEATARWFRSLTVEEWLEVFQSFAALAESNESWRDRLTIQEVAAQYAHTPPDRIRIVQFPATDPPRNRKRKWDDD